MKPIRLKFWSAEKLFSVTAFLVSIGTLFTFIYQTRLIQKQQYASVLPYLSMGGSNPNAGTFKFGIVNNGVGPAFVKKVSVRYQGKIYDYDPATFIYRVIYPKDTIDFYYANMVPGRVIPAGREVELIGINNSEKDAQKLRRLFNNGNNAVLEVTYSSLYDETWKISGVADPPVKLDD